MKKIFVVDPSLFSLPYDKKLVEELSKVELLDVTLFGRVLRENESKNFSFNFIPYFYNFTSKLGLKNKYLKALEHCMNMLFFLFFVIRKRPDAVHFQWLAIPFVDSFFIKAIKLFSSSKVIFTAHNSTAFHGESTSPLQSLYWEKSHLVFDRIQVHNHETAIKLINNGIAIQDKFFIAPHGPLSSINYINQEEVDTPVKVYDFIMFGNLKGYKGVSFYLEALSELYEKGFKFKALMVGRQYLSEADLNLSSKLEALGVLDTKFGYLKDEELESFVRFTKFAVFPYKEIDGSGALALAVSLGSVPIITKLPGLLEPTDNGKNALLIAELTIDSLTQTLIEALSVSSLRLHETSERGKLFFINHYSWENAALILTEEYSK